MTMWMPVIGVLGREHFGMEATRGKTERKCGDKEDSKKSETKKVERGKKKE